MLHSNVNEIETQIRQEAAVVLNASLASSSSINEAQNYDKAVAAAATSFDSSASQNFETNYNRLSNRFGFRL